MNAVRYVIASPCLAILCAAISPAQENKIVMTHVKYDGLKQEILKLRGKVVIVDFWAHNCQPCRAAFPKFLKMHEKYGEKGSVHFARAFILVVTGIAYFVALVTPESIFELAVRFAFSGFAAMAPVMVAALFWKRSSKWGALASTLWVAACLVGQLIVGHGHEQLEQLLGLVQIILPGGGPHEETAEHRLAHIHGIEKALQAIL